MQSQKIKYSMIKGRCNKVSWFISLWKGKEVWNELKLYILGFKKVKNIIQKSLQISRGKRRRAHIVKKIRLSSIN